MSKYTTEVRYICENYAGLTESKGFDDIETIITEAAPKVFNFSFPIFDENYRLSLEKQILRKYYTREICEETVGLWKLRLWTKLNLIMPYYNEMYKSALLEFNPFYDVDLTREHQTVNNGNQETQNSGNNTRTDNLTQTDNNTRTDNLKKEIDSTQTNDTTQTDDYTRTDDLKKEVENTQTNNTTQTDDFTRTDNLHTDKTTENDLTKVTTDTDKTRWDLYSDTPQGGINGIEAATDSVADNAYLTNARKIIENGGTSETNTGTIDESVDNTGTVKNGGTRKDTGTIDNDGTELNTGTVKNVGTRKDTGTIDNESTETNTGTVRNNGTKTNTGTVTNVETNTGSQTIHNVEDYLEHVKGKTSGISYSKLLKEYRETFLNIDKMLVDELNDLFILLW